MSATITPPPKPAAPVHYPDSDGKPMADNTIQFRWILMLYAHLAAQYRSDAEVFVAGDHLIYPVEGDNKLRQAPDVYVAFGRPKGDRGSYRAWEEGGVFPQVVFEVWSPNNRYGEMQDKFAFYEKHGAEEYYIIYPEFPMHAEAFRRDGGKLVGVEEVDGYASPRTGLRFALKKGHLTVSGRDGQPLKAVEEQVAEREAAERAATEQKEKAAKLAAKLRELGIDPDAV
jgi:Uma2 family endonuclease